MNSAYHLWNVKCSYGQNSPKAVTKVVQLSPTLWGGPDQQNQPAQAQCEEWSSKIYPQKTRNLNSSERDEKPPVVHPEFSTERPIKRC